MSAAFMLILIINLSLFRILRSRSNSVAINQAIRLATCKQWCIFKQKTISPLTRKQNVLKLIEAVILETSELNQMTRLEAKKNGLPIKITTIVTKERWKMKKVP